MRNLTPLRFYILAIAIVYSTPTFATDLFAQCSPLTFNLAVGDTANLTFEADNTSGSGGGPFDSTNTKFTFIYGMGFSIQSSSLPTGATITDTPGSQEAVINFGNVDKETITSALVVVKAIYPGDYNLTTTLVGDLLDPDTTNNNCNITAIVTTKTGLSTGTSSGNTPNAAQVKDPINTFSGEFYNQFNADIDLGGPLKLSFSRYYGSSLATDAIVTSTLGVNWRHNFDWLLNNTGTDIDILSPQGTLIEFTSNGGLWDQSGNSTVLYQLVENSGEFTLLNVKNELFYVFSEAGLLTNINDGKGNQHNITYNNSDQTTQVSDGIGRTLSFTYSNNKLKTVSDGTRTVSFTHTGDDLITTTSSLGNITTYAYTTGGLMTSMIKPEGNTLISQAYDSNNRVISQTDGEGHTTTLNFSSNNITTITDPLSSTTKHTHTATGELTKTEDPDGSLVILGSNAAGQRNSITDRLSGLTSLTYHEQSGKLASITDTEGNTANYSYTERIKSGLTLFDLTATILPDNTTKSATYDATGNVLSRTDQLGNISSSTFNSKGQKLTFTNKLGGVTTNIYNVDGTLASVTDYAGNLTTFDYDALMRPIMRTLSDGNTETYTYDNANRMLNTTDTRNNTAALSYDNNSNLAAITSFLNERTTFTYDDNDRAISMTDPMLGIVTIAYDSLGNVSTVTDELGGIITHGYDVFNNLTSITNPLDNTWGLSYDVEGTITSKINPLGNTTTFTSDNMGRTTQITSALGNSSSLTYDAIGRISTTTDPMGNVTSFNRDAMGFLSGITLNGASITTTYTRNKSGQLLKVTDPNGNDWERTYDNGGRLISSNDPLGNLNVVTYDNRNRISTIVYPDTMGSLTMEYDAGGHPIGRSYSDGTALSYSFNANSRLISAKGISNTYNANGRITNSNGIATNYDAKGRITSMTLAVGKVLTYTYDSNDQLKSVVDWTTGVTSFTYNAAGHLTAISRPNGINRSNSYDNDSRLIGVNEGNDTSIDLTLDAKGQTTEAVRVIPHALTAGGVTKINTYNSASQVDSYTHDKMGRTTLADSNRYTWNLASRLVSFSKEGAIATATYDGAGLRLSRTLGTTTTNYVWSYALSVPSILIEKQGNTDQRYYIRMPGGELLYSIDASSNTRSFYHFDEMGNTLFLSNDSGTTIASYSYTPFGLLTSPPTNLNNPFTWQGEFGIQDEGNGLYYIKARYYDANIGRFISRDPIERDKLRSVNPYQYSFGNPLKFRDITGRTPRKKSPEPEVPVSEVGGATVAVLGLGLKSTSSSLSGSGIGLAGDVLNLGIHLSEDEIDTGKVLEDVGLVTVDVAGIGLTASGAAASAAVGPVVAVYAVSKLGIVTYEAWWDLQASEQRLEATIFAGELEKKKATRIQAEKQERIEQEITNRHDEYLRKQQEFREEIKAAEEAGENTEVLRRKSLRYLSKILFPS